MSITDKLRSWGRGKFADGLFNDVYEELLPIADRIDEAHKHAVMSVMNDALYHANDESMAELGWLRLPKDADGVPIRIGDTMEWLDGSTAEVIGIGDGVFFYKDDESDGADWSSAENKRHHREPTVEDVLREFAQEMNENLGMYTGEEIDADEWRDADNKTIAEYAAKLRLAGEAE